MLADYYKRFGDGPYFSAHETKKGSAVCCVCDRPIRGEHSLFWGHHQGDHFEFHAHIECANAKYGHESLGRADVAEIRERQRVPTLFEI